MQTTASQAGSYLAAQYDVAKVLAERGTLEEAAPEVLSIICQRLDWDIGELWVIDREAKGLRRLAVYASPALEDAPFVGLSGSLRFLPGDPIPGSVWQSAKPVWFEDIGGEPPLKRSTPAHEAGLHAVFGFPITLGEEVLGVLDFFSRHSRARDEALLDAVAGLGSQIGQFMTRVHGETAVRDARSQLEAVLRGIPDAVIAHDPEGRFVYANAAGLKLVGVDSLDAFLGRSPRQLARGFEILDQHGVRIAPAALPMRQALETQSPAEELLRLKETATGEETWVSIRSLPVGTEASKDRLIVNIIRDVTERKRAEDALLQSEDLYRTLADSMPALVLLLDPLGNLTYYNQRLLDYTGKSAEEMTGTSWLDSIHPEDREGVVEGWRNARDRAEQLENEFRVRRSDGEYRWHLARTRPIFDASGAIARWVALSTDIEEQKRTEEALRQSEELYRTVADSLPALVVLSDGGGNVIYYNRRYQDFVGRPNEELQAEPFAVVHPADEPRLRDLWRKALTTGEPIESELRFRRADGEYRWHLSRSTPVRESKSITLWITVNVEVEEQKRAADMIAFLSSANVVLASTLEYEKTLENVVRLCVPAIADFCAVYVREESGYIKRILSSYEDRFSYWMRRLPDERALPPSVRQAMESATPVLYEEIPLNVLEQNSADAGQFDDMLAAHFRSGIVAPLVARDRTIGVLVLATSTRTYGVGNLRFTEELASRMALAIDNARLYSESRKVQEQLRQANEAKDEFLGLMSHELRTPTTTIYGGARVLRARSNTLTTEDREDVLADIEQEAERLYRMIEDLLVLARLDAGEKVPVEPVLLQRLMPRIVTNFSHRKPTRKVLTETDETLDAVSGEPVYIEQVLRNLLGNADKYSPEDQAIELSAVRRDGEVVVSVADRGPGVKPEDLETIFERFYRAEKTALQVRGMGLGLTLCRRLVEAQRGRIWAERRPGGGLIIRFALPFYESSED